MTGALAYLSAPLWLGFLVLSTWLLLAHVNVEPQYFVSRTSSFRSGRHGAQSMP